MSSDWHARPCLVTGGAGFGGSHLCSALVARNAKVYVLDRIFARTSYLTLQGLDRRVELIQGDVRDADLVRSCIERYAIDTIFHLAAQPLAPVSNVLPFETLSINALGTYTLLEAMRATQCAKTFVFASSGAHYGATSTTQPILEDAPVCPAVNLYGPSKTAADVVVRTYANVYGLGTAVCRFMNTYGPGDTNFSRLVPRAVRNLMEGAEYAFGDRDDGSTRLDFLHIRDMTRAYLSVAEHMDVAKGEAFNFGRGQPISTREIAQLVSRAFDDREREPLFGGARREHPVIKTLDIHKAERMLGWKPETPLEAGLRDTVDWYRKHWPAL